MREQVSVIPIRGYVAAGYPQEAEDQPLGWVMVPLPHTGGDLYGLVVRGDSMQGAGIRSGQIVLIRRQSTFEDGDIVVAAIDGEATLKRINREGRGYRLDAEHPNHPTLFITPEALRYDGSQGESARPGAGSTSSPIDVKVLGLMVGMLSEAAFSLEPPL